MRGYGDGSVPDYQMAAFAMAVYFRGLDPDETAALTLAMRDSGETIPRGTYGGVAVDKHSTGGVGDKVSIALAPLVACAGIKVPMICGRGLGHTGGTVDKMESIPGYRARLAREEFVSNVKRLGVVIGGQSETLAPVDRALYALRDVTGTVESIPLITASILSKKLAEGLDGLVIDVKCGRGAFMKSEPDARALAESLARVGRSAGITVTAVLTRMDDPLGRTIGNALEVREAIEILRGEGSADVVEVTRALAEAMFAIGGVPDPAGFFDRLIASGDALRRLADVVAAQGGRGDAILAPDDHLPRAPYVEEITADREGFVDAIDAFAFGEATIELGGGRRRSDEAIDPSVGFELLARRGDRLVRGQPLVRIHARSRDDAAAVRETVTTAYTVADRAPAAASRVLETIRY